MCECLPRSQYCKSKMEVITNESQLNQIPVLYVQGTYYAIGFAIGRQCKTPIDSVINNWKFFNEVVVEKYLTPEGKGIYDGCLSLCTRKFPMYIEELKGMANGAGIPFYKLFLLHIDSLIVSPELEDEYGKQKMQTGCTTVMSNYDKVIIGHTEDACPEFLNNVFIVSALVVNDAGETLEKFTTLTYAGYLPGYTMGYNCHGLIYTVNTIFPKVTQPQGTPRNFLARAILKSSNLHEVLDILQDSGDGRADGFSVNIHFANQEGSPILHNIEVGPARSIHTESELSVLNISHGEYHVHCNKYLRLKLEEIEGVGMESSTHRHKTIGRHLPPNNVSKIKSILSDQSDPEYPVFRQGKKQDFVKTVAVGVFDITNRKWYIFMEPPANAMPVAVLPIDTQLSIV